MEEALAVSPDKRNVYIALWWWKHGVEAGKLAINENIYRPNSSK